jgi:hypothetical protein
MAYHPAYVLEQIWSRHIFAYFQEGSNVGCFEVTHEVRDIYWYLLDRCF